MKTFLHLKTKPFLHKANKHFLHRVSENNGLSNPPSQTHRKNKNAEQSEAKKIQNTFFSKRYHQERSPESRPQIGGHRNTQQKHLSS